MTRTTTRPILHPTRTERYTVSYRVNTGRGVYDRAEQTVDGRPVHRSHADALRAAATLRAHGFRTRIDPVDPSHAGDGHAIG